MPSERGYGDLIAMLEEVRAHSQPARGDIAWADGRVFSCQITPVEGGGQVAVLHDITYFKDLEELKNEFIAAASHDLKNPINLVMGFSDLLPKVGPLNETQTEFDGRVRGAAEQMHDLVLKILELMGTELTGSKAAWTRCDLAEMARTTMDEFETQAGTKGQSLELETFSLVPVLDDPQRMRQVFRNLIGNAIKYTPAGGQIDIVVAVNGDQAEFIVRDSGIGIAADEIPHLFRTFYRIESDETAGIQGNGLGLSIVKSVVAQHGGQIEVKSQFGSGSQFRVLLPLQAQVETVAV